jgi:hypothetical protein
MLFKSLACLGSSAAKNTYYMFQMLIKNTRFQAGILVSAAGIEPATNGLKGLSKKVLLLSNENLERDFSRT